jgi:hypothetical protein
MSDSTRRISDLLPEVLQTDVLRKFMAATADHLFAPARVEYVNGFIGQRPGWYDPTTDIYVQEPTTTRQNYQVEPTAISRDYQTNDINHVLFYEDLINTLRYQGALVNDHNRLFEQEYYSLGLPVDLDKLVNWQNYYWLPQGPNTIILLDATNISQIQQSSSYVYTGNYSYENDSGTVIQGSITLTCGLKLQFSQDDNTQIRGTKFLVEGVGRQIVLVPDVSLSASSWDNPPEWDSTNWDQATVYTTPEYWLLGRGSSNSNPWSVRNRWFHRDVVTQSRTVLTQGDVLAHRAILEFDRNTQLYDFGTVLRATVDIIDTTAVDIVAQIEGQSSYVIDNVQLDDGMIILFVNLRDSAANNRLYRVNGLRNGGSIILELLPSGTDITGAPHMGDYVTVRQRYQDRANSSHTALYGWSDTSWLWDQALSVWRMGQQWAQHNSTGADGVRLTTPLFQLYDTQGNSLSDGNIYPLTDFAGCTLLQYDTDSSQPLDAYLNIHAVYDVNQPTEFVFSNTLVSNSYSYQPTNVRIPMTGFFFYCITDGVDEFCNNWWQSASLSRQYVINEFVGTGSQTTYVLDQAPDTSAPPPISITVEVAGRSLQLNTDYTVSDNVLTLVTAPAENQPLRVRTYNPQPTVSQGYFEIPTNLAANANNQQLSTLTRSQILDHVISIMNNQLGFMGQAVGINNWRDTAQDQSLGTVILQHRAPMLKLMTLNAVAQADVISNTLSGTDFMTVMQWSQREYLRFYNKYVNQLFNLYNSGGLTGVEPIQTWIDKALAVVNLGKTSTSAWVNSGPDTFQGSYCGSESVSPTWVPATATRLGVTPAYEPRAFYDVLQPSQPLSLLCHNGAIVVLRDSNNQDLGGIEGNLVSTTNAATLTHPVARAWMQFEVNLFNNLPPSYQDPDTVLALDPRIIFSGRWRSTNYTWQDGNALRQRSFERWLTQNQLNVYRNTTFDIADPFSWNYNTCVDFDNQPLPGSWRAIYRYFYDTDRPHTAPWEMLGFSQKPTWWDSEYGSAPYTSGNTRLWQHLQEGYIAQGARQGYHTQWARPQLSQCIPVDAYGQLLPPVAAGIVRIAPSVQQASADWKFGDLSPIEYVWTTTVDHDFVTAQVSYLAKPAQFVEYAWDTTRTERIFATQSNSQWIYTDVGRRKSSSEFFVHRENPSSVQGSTSTSSYYGSCGIQHWLSEYLINDNRDVTVYLGNIVRGSGVNLAYRVAGFLDGTSVKLLVNSFGFGSTQGLLLPQEDNNTILLRSSSTNEFFYSGVIVEYMGSSGWRVIGYDTVEPSFTIIPSMTTGPRTTVVIDKQRVFEYQTGVNTTQTVPYGTTFATRQEVYDFLVSLGRWQTAQGWIFDGYDDAASKVQNWSLSAREFLFWSQGPWAAGNFIALSPLATSAKFATQFGNIQYVGNIVNGVYSLLDKGGRPIQSRNVDFMRIDNEISVRPLNDQGIYGLRLFTTTLEHALILNNTTIFNDTIYDPVLNLRQSRFRMLTYKSSDWNGRMDAPGYIVTQTQTTIGDRIILNNKVLTNFEKSVTDLLQMYNIDEPTPYNVNNAVTFSKQTSSNSSTTNNLAQHLIAYQSRDYLTNLLVDDTTQFHFYQGMIQQKGTQASITALTRDTHVLSLDQTLNYYEEYAFRTGTYGATDVIHKVDVQLRQQDVSGNPQLINLLGGNSYDNPLDDVINIVPADPRIVDCSPALPAWSTRSSYGASVQDLPTAGYVLQSETTHEVVDDTAMMALWKNLYNMGQTLQQNDVVWKYVDTTRGWDIYLVSKPTWHVVSIGPDPAGSGLTMVVTDTNHNLATNTMVVIADVTGINQAVQGTYNIQNASGNTFYISYTSNNTGTVNTLFVYTSIRFASVAARDAAVIQGGWRDKNMAYVDGSATSPWQVYVYYSNQWVLDRQQTLTVDLSLFNNSRLYDLGTGSTQTSLSLWNPIRGALPGGVDKYITYKTIWDPAQYNTGDSYSYALNFAGTWGARQVGYLWWDLSTVRFMDYEIGSDSYRRQHWGQVAAGTSVDIYEWVRSTVPPASWAGAVAANNTAATGGDSSPTGTIKNSTYPYVISTEISNTGVSVTYYYFWVKNPTSVMDGSGRLVSAQQISNTIVNPSGQNISWWAPISTTTALLGNIGALLTGDQTVWSVSWLNQQGVDKIYKQWTLLRPGDPRSTPTAQLWNRMRASLVETDALGNAVPDMRLRVANRYGTLSRPSQTWFHDVTSARRNFTNSVNDILASSSVPPALDQQRLNWLPYFTSQEPQPSATNTKANVRVATTQMLTAVYQNGQDGIGATLTGMDNQPLVLDGVTVQLEDRVLVKDQPMDVSSLPVGVQLNNATQNGIYELINTTPWCLQRTTDFNSTDSNLTQATVTVTQGNSQAGNIYHQTNDNIFAVGTQNITWAKGPGQIVWDYHVSTLSDRDALSNQVAINTQVLVDASSTTQGRWTIWLWDGVEWQLQRVQSYNTNQCWSLVDWYASGYSSSTTTTLVFDNFTQRDSYASYPGFADGDIIRVNNTGNGDWALYTYAAATTSYTLVGIAHGGIQLSDNLWNYAAYQMGWDGGNYAVDYEGWDYDTRLELDQIIEGLWPHATGIQGLLKTDTKINEYNTLFFNMVNHVLAEQTFVDWVFKTSFINLRGFAQTLTTNPYYVNSNIDDVIAYVNEVKPYHAQIRQFIDLRLVNDLWQDASTDFDKPPYVNQQGQQIDLDPNNPSDQDILATPTYKDWYQNWQTISRLNTSKAIQDAMLMRRLHTQLVLDRLACSSAAADWYADGYSASTTPTYIVDTWQDVSSLPLAEGQTVKITNYWPYRWRLYAFVNTLSDMQLVGYQNYNGAVDRIASSYQPTGDMLAADAPGLISGCAAKGTILDGYEFSTAGKWGEPIWDAYQGWDNTVDTAGTYLDVSINGGEPPKYWIYQGDGVRTDFPLPVPPQAPSNLKVWVNGVVLSTPTDWTVSNWVTAVTVANPGLGYEVNDTLTLMGGTSTVSATLRVINVSPIGEITSVELLEPGVYTVTPNTAAIAVGGGHGIDANVVVRWGGTTIHFASAPSLPTNRPNIWIAEGGSTFLPAVGTTLDTIYDGVGLNRAHSEPNHPEEFVPLWPRDTLKLNTYTAANSGFGNVMVESFLTDGITDTFPIGQPIVGSTQLLITWNGVLQNYGADKDYVVNMLSNQVKFVVAPAPGKLEITSLRLGGDSQSLAYLAISNAGQGYHVGDQLTLVGGVAISDPDPQWPYVKVTEIKCVDLLLHNGGSGYNVGDLIYLQGGVLTQEVVVRVDAVTFLGNVKGIITAVSIANAGIYQQFSVGNYTWITNHAGTGAVIEPIWGIQTLEFISRGAFIIEPMTLTQGSIDPPGGSGVEVLYSPGYHVEYRVIPGDGVNSNIDLMYPTTNDYVLVTVNGEITTNWTIAPDTPTILRLGFVPALTDVLVINVFASKFVSIERRQSFTATAALTYTLDNPPQHSTAQSKLAIVYKNNHKLRPPYISQQMGDGVTSAYNLAIVPSSSGMLQVWINNVIQASASYSLVGRTVNFLTAPPPSSRIIFQVADSVLQNYDYYVSGNSITFASWAITLGDNMVVITFPEDVSASFVNDTIQGNDTTDYVMSQAPADFASVMVWVNGITAVPIFDYEILHLNGVTVVRMANTLGATDVLQFYYPTLPPSVPAVAFTTFKNIYDETQYLRIPLSARTYLTQDVHYNSEEIYVEDGNKLVEPFSTRPGVIWIGNERVEYYEKTPEPTAQLPNQSKLSKINRGTLGTPAGVADSFVNQFYSGNGQAANFRVPDTMNINQGGVHVIVNGQTQTLNQDYVFISIQTPQDVQQYTLAMGTYLNFMADRIPSVGNNNILLSISQTDWRTQTVSWRAGSVVIDASSKQVIPGGYVWPYGSYGIQFSYIYQTKFLYEDPGILPP